MTIVSGQGGGSENRAVVIGADNALRAPFLSTSGDLPGNFAQIAGFGTGLGLFPRFATDAAAPLAGDFGDAAHGLALRPGQADASATARARPGRDQG